MSTFFHDPIEKEAPGRGITVNRPVGQLDEAVGRLPNQLDATGNVVLGPPSDFTTGHVVLGDAHLWPDPDGKLRFKATQPTSDRDGSVIASQDPIDPPPPPPDEGEAPITAPISPQLVFTFDQRGFGFNTFSSLMAVGDDTLIAGTGSTFGSHAYIVVGRRPYISWTATQNLAQRFIYSQADLGGGVVMAGTGPYGRVYRSEDTGATWALRQQLRAVREGAEIRAMISMGGGVVLAGNASTGRIYRSTDNGANWLSVSVPRFRGNTRVWDFAIGTGDRVHAAIGGARPETYYSDDRGATWRLPTTLPNSGIGIGAIAALPDGRMVCGSDENAQAPVMFTSDDGGVTWDGRQRLGGHPGRAGRRVMSILPLGGQRVICSTGNVDCHVYESTDRGETWAYRATPGNADWGYDMVRSGNEVYITTTNPMALYRLA